MVVHEVAISTVEATIFKKNSSSVSYQATNPVVNKYCNILNKQKTEHSMGSCEHAFMSNSKTLSSEDPARSTVKITRPLCTT